MFILHSMCWTAQYIVRWSSIENQQITPQILLGDIRRERVGREGWREGRRGEGVGRGGGMEGWREAKGRKRGICHEYVSPILFVFMVNCAYWVSIGYFQGGPPEHQGEKTSQDQKKFVTIPDHRIMLTEGKERLGRLGVGLDQICFFFLPKFSTHFAFYCTHFAYHQESCCSWMNVP